jgi:anti-sigma factor RsiW
MRVPHLSDDRLIELALGRLSTVRDDGHLASCAACQSRHASLAVLLDEIGEASTIEADHAFPAAKLARQRARILERVAQIGVPGRVLSFPRISGGMSSALGWKPNTRWVAAAALAGLLVGLLADHALTRFPGAPRRAARDVTPVASTDASPSMRPVASNAQSEDEFFGQLEAAVGSAGPLVLHPLDAMTPRAWDVAQ